LVANEKSNVNDVIFLQSPLAGDIAKGPKYT